MAGAKSQPRLWASTGVKDPAYQSTMYVEELINAGVVNTMPEATLKAFAEEGEVRGDTVRAVFTVVVRTHLDDRLSAGEHRLWAVEVRSARADPASC